MMRLQRWESGPYFADFSLHIPDMCVEIVKIWTALPPFRFRTPKSDRLLENASFLSPLVYTQLIWVMLAGFIVLGDLPDSRALFGMAIIVASGLYVARGHRFRAKEFPETPID